MADPFPLWYPPDARRLFTSDGMLRRIARTAHWGATSRVLELCGSTATSALARDVGCQVTVADDDATALDGVRERLKAHGLADKVQVRQGAFSALPFPDGDFDGVAVLGRVLMRLEQAATGFRRLLAPKGRLVLTYPARVGRFPSEQSLKAWEARLGEPLRLPRDLLSAVEKCGYEPETIETVGDTELDDFYRELEKSVANAATPGAKAVADEVALHRSQNGRTGVSYAVLVARRKEPGERPPASRDGG